MFASFVSLVLEEKVLILAAWARNIVLTEFKPRLELISQSIDKLKTDEDMDNPSNVVHTMERVRTHPFTSSKVTNWVFFFF